MTLNFLVVFNVHLGFNLCGITSYKSILLRVTSVLQTAQGSLLCWMHLGFLIKFCVSILIVT
jgi:hypothetical protein